MLIHCWHGWTLITNLLSRPHLSITWYVKQSQTFASRLAPDFRKYIRDWSHWGSALLGPQKEIGMYSWRTARNCQVQKRIQNRHLKTICTAERSFHALTFLWRCRARGTESGISVTVFFCVTFSSCWIFSLRSPYKKSNNQQQNYDMNQACHSMPAFPSVAEYWWRLYDLMKHLLSAGTLHCMRQDI